MSKNKRFKQARARKKTVKKENLSINHGSVFANYLKNHKGAIITIVFGAIGFLTIPNLLRLPYSSLDCSWVIGLTMAKVLGLQFGKDIVFPFGPLGFMYYPYYCEFNTWLVSSTFCLFVHCLFIFSIIIMIKKLSLHPIDCVLMGLTLMLALPQIYIEYKVLFSVIILLYLSIVAPFKSKTQLILYVFASSMMAVTSLIKFTAVMVSLGILLFIFIFYLYKKQINYFCYMLFSYIASILVLLIASGQKLINLPSYLLNSYEVSDGYNSAMTVSGPGKEVFAGFCIVAMFTLLLLNSIFKNKHSLKYFIFINLGLVFVSFKHGLIRHDISHISICFVNALLVFCCVYVTNKKQLNLLMRSLTLILLFVLGAFIFEHSPRRIIPDIPGKAKIIGSAVSLATGDAAGKAQILEDAKSKMRRVHSLKNETLQYINKKPVDVMPWEISLAYAYDLNWSPRPVFQCYSAYTDKLDMLNSQYFESDRAPELLLYTLACIDKRHPLFDAPATFRTILRKYKPVSVDGKYIVLQKSNIQPPSLSKTISILDTELGKPIMVPKTNGYLFAKIYMDYNFLGKIAKLLYKPPKVNIKLIANRRASEHRFIFSSARNGIFVSQPVYGLRDLLNIWSGKLNNNLDAIVISTKNPGFYNKHIKVEFFEISR